ncbi:MAG TPA: ABC-type transport auxiliary lipoprotein family protein [Candidatus Acidoferrum sp.]|nr:ABC-type transport auxiliary lipoprotein family protein [Candidatus Acidoferrum sp.]
MRRILLALAVLTVAGFYASCGAARPISYYTLAVPPAPAVSPSPQFHVDLLVGRLEASQLYRTDRIAYGSGPVEMGLYDNNRWASTPVDMVQDALISTLRATGQYRTVNRLASAMRGDYIIRGHLYSLYEVDKPQLVGRFSVQIELFDPKSRTTLWSGTYSHDEPVQGTTVPDVMTALNQNVSQGLQQLCSELGQYFAAHPPAAPAAASSSD